MGGVARIRIVVCSGLYWGPPISEAGLLVRAVAGRLCQSSMQASQSLRRVFYVNS